MPSSAMHATSDIDNWGAVCVTGAGDVMDVLSFPGDEPAGRPVARSCHGTCSTR